MAGTSSKKVFASGFWFTVSNFTMKAIGFITTPVFTRLMTKAEYGDFYNIQTWMMILLYVTSLNLESSLIRASQEFSDDLDGYAFSMVSLSTISTLIWWGIANLFANQVTGLFSVDRTYMNAMFIYALFCPAVNIFQNAERFKFKYKWTVLTSMTISIGASLLSVLLVVLMKDNRLMGRTIGYIAPTFILGIVIMLYYFLKVKKVNFKYWKYALPIALPYIPHLLSMYLLSNMDRVMIKKFCGPEYVALYSLAYTSGMVISILVTSINNAYSPWLAEKLNAKEYDAIKKVSLPYVAIFSYFALGAVMITPEILYVLGGEKYIEAKYVMPPVAAGCLLQFTYCMYVNIEQYEKKTVGMAIASAIAAVANFGLNYLFIPKFGYVAAAYTTYAGYMLLLLLHVYIVHRQKMSFVYKNTLIIIVALSMSAVIFMTNFLMDMTVVRYIIVAVYAAVGGVVVLKNKSLVMQLLRSKK